MRPYQKVLPMVVSALSASTALAAVYLETFDGWGDPAPLSSAGWSVISGTGNPVTVSPDFAINNNQNVIKITAGNDAGSQFTSAHVFVEHDYWTASPPDLGVDPDNAGRGDVLIFTDEFLATFGAVAIDIRGATVSVDYANGTATEAGPSFHFAFMLSDGTWWINATAYPGQTTAAVTQAQLSAIDNTRLFVPLLVDPLNVLNPDARLIPDPANARPLNNVELASVTAVGLYIQPAGDAVPSRFDNYTLSGFRAVPAPPPTVVSAVSRKPHAGLPYDITVSTPGAVENRSGGLTQLFVTFSATVVRATGTTADVALSRGTVTTVGLVNNLLIVFISGVTTPGPVTVSFPGIKGFAGQNIDDRLCFVVLNGDVTADRSVSIFDLVAVRNNFGQAVSASNFRSDVNIDGVINIFDQVAVRNVLGLSSPACP